MLTYKLTYVFLIFGNNINIKEKKIAVNLFFHISYANKQEK